MTDKEIREQIKKIKNFYMNISWHVVFNFFAMVIWLFLGNREYWPIFVHLTSAMMLCVDAYRMGLIELPEADFLPFLREEWEEEKFKELKARKAKTKSKND